MEDTLASFLDLVEVGRPGCRVPVHTFVTPRLGVIMIPCGHDHGELNHVSRPHRGGGSCRDSSCVVAVPDITLRRWRGSGFRRRVGRSRRA